MIWVRSCLGWRNGELIGNFCDNIYKLNQKNGNFSKINKIMEAVLDKEIVKKALKELMVEDLSSFKQILKEVISESFYEDAEFENLIKKNFKKYEATYRALA